MDLLTALPLLALIGALFATVAWIRAERRSSFRARLAWGVASSILWIFNALMWTHLMPTYERTFTRRALRGLEEILDRGDIDSARRAVATYNTAVTNAGGYTASQRMNASVRAALEAQR